MALDLPREDLIEVLSTGRIDLAGRFVWGSNHTFIAEVAADAIRLKAVYKPAAGERPLWDFPSQTLAQREVAAYLTSVALGWQLVPPTVLRSDGPAGGGSLQYFVDVDPERHYFTFSPQERQLLAPAALFDVLINNADRKGGHVLLGPHNQVWLIDHGVCFHEEYKLRTVIWDLAGRPIAPELLRDLKDFLNRLVAEPSVTQDSDASGIGAANQQAHPDQRSLPSAGPQTELAQLSQLLSPAELEALERRARRLLATGRYPAPGAERHFPWPLIQ